MARAANLAVVSHVRDAHAEAAAILGEERAGDGVIHCFSGGVAEARAYLDLGQYLSFSGILTFKNAGNLREAAAFAPLDRILIETDAPYLAPIPHRGRKNEPAYIAETLAALAAVRGHAGGRGRRGDRDEHAAPVPLAVAGAIGGYWLALVSSTAPVRIRLRFASFDAFIDKFAPNVTRGGVFIASRTPLPIGATFAFEIQLAGGEVALAGDGKVTWVKAFDPAAPQKPHGMGVQFLRLDNPSRELLNKILARKAAPGGSGAVRAPVGGRGIGRSSARRQRDGVAPEGGHQRRPGGGVRRRRGAPAARRRPQLAEGGG